MIVGPKANASSNWLERSTSVPMATAVGLELTADERPIRSGTGVGMWDVGSGNKPIYRAI